MLIILKNRTLQFTSSEFKLEQNLGICSNSISYFKNQLQDLKECIITKKNLALSLSMMYMKINHTLNIIYCFIQSTTYAQFSL